MSSIDIEITNRCNAKCHFCPRDATPHQGLMSREVFDQAMVRAIEYREAATPVLGFEPGISLCGLGEPLLHKDAATFARQVREAGFHCGMSSNGALLDQRRGAALLEAGLQQIFINVGDRDEAYEDVYQLPFEKTRANVARFVEMAGDDCEVVVVLVDYRADKAHLAAMREYWESYGVTRFREYDIINRGGALFVDHMQFETLPQLGEAHAMLDGVNGVPICGTPFAFLFIGYDGKYYLCCSDWKKEVSFGTVFDGSFLDITAAKLRYVRERGPVCRTCNLDPVNALTDMLRADAEGQPPADGERDALIAALRAQSDGVMEVIEQLVPGVSADDPRPPGPPRRLIPVTAR
jgi:MoaA/NifB/PqqE/SkfB family radical SAM enzyme